MKKLLQINVVANSGSTGRIAENIGKLAISQRWESYIAYGRGNPESTSELLRIGTNCDMYMHGLQSRLLDNHGLASVGATKKFVEEIKRINPDVIHLHNIHGYYLNYKILFEYLSTIDTPVVWTLHDCWAFTGHCSHFDAIGCEKWQTGCFSCPLKGEYPVSKFVDASARNYALKKRLFASVPNLTIVPVSRWLAGLVGRSFLGEYPIRVINNGIDTEVFQQRESALRQKHNIEGKFVLVGVAGVWDAMKGFDDFIKLSRLLPDDCVIIMIGLTKKQIDILPPNIIGIERTESQAQLAEYYSMADVIMNLSYQETFGMTTVEGFGCGTPGIVYDRTASPELISQDTGIIVKAGYMNGLLSAIETIKSNGKKHYSAACRQRAVECYNKDDKFNEYINLYNSLTLGDK